MNPQKIAPYTEYLMADCWHRNIYTPEEAQEARVEDQRNPETGQEELALVCRACANGERGFCHNTVVHRVIAVTPKLLIIQGLDAATSREQ